jgi:plastocyanin
MTNNLDSRALGRADCYGQRFMKAGDYPYNVVPAHGRLISTDRPFVVRVRQGSAKAMKQHNVQVAVDCGKLVASEREITIDVGDLVLWNCVSDHPVAVVSEHDFFASHRLTNECGFSHAFGTPGDYHWVDAYGSGLSGVIRVRDPGVKAETDLKRWLQTLSEGKMVMIADNKPQPAEVEIVTGQTVFFAVVKGPGISITDAALLNQAGDRRDPVPGKPKARGVMRY